MTYKVKKGDTLSEIAKSFGVDMWDLANANGIRNPNYIRVGQVLTIPGNEPEKEPAEQGVSYADIGRAVMKALAKFEDLPEFKELAGLIDG